MASPVAGRGPDASEPAGRRTTGPARMAGAPRRRARRAAGMPGTARPGPAAPASAG